MRRGCSVAWLVGIGAILLEVALAPACGGKAPSYRVTVAFDTSVTQADMDGVDQILRRYDSGAEVLVIETFPPVAHATLKTGTPDFCRKVEPELDALSSVENVSCERLDGGGGGGG